MKIEININVKNYKVIDAYVRKELGKSLKQLMEQRVDMLIKNVTEQTVLRQQIAIDIQNIQKAIKIGKIIIPPSALKWERRDDETNKAR